MKHTEYEEQCKVVEYLRKVHPNVLFTASIAGHVKMTIPQWKRAVKAGYAKGTPDLMIFALGRAYGLEREILFIEMKRKDGRLSLAQRDFLSNLHYRSYTARVCMSAECAIHTIEQYLQGTL